MSVAKRPHKSGLPGQLILGLAPCARCPGAHIHIHVQAPNNLHVLVRPFRLLPSAFCGLPCLGGDLSRDDRAVGMLSIAIARQDTQKPFAYAEGWRICCVFL